MSDAELAKALFEYFTELKKAGFSPAEAIQLVQFRQISYLSAPESTEPWK